MKGFALLCLLLIATWAVSTAQPTSIVRISGPKKTLLRGLAKDMDGNIYATGLCNFKTQADVFTNFSSKDSNDAYIVKYSAGGVASWARTFGSHGTDLGALLTTDKLGNVYCAAYIGDTMKIGKDVFPAGSSQSAVIVKYDKYGNYVWGKSFFGNGISVWKSLQVDSMGNIYAAGVSKSDTIHLDAFKSTGKGSQSYSSFIAGISPTGNVISFHSFKNTYGNATYGGTVTKNGTYYAYFRMDSGTNWIDNQKIVSPFIGEALVKFSGGGPVIVINKSNKSNIESLFSEIGNDNNIYSLMTYTDSFSWSGKILKNKFHDSRYFLAKQDTLGTIKRIDDFLYKPVVAPGTIHFTLDTFGRVYVTGLGFTPLYINNRKIQSYDNLFYVALFDTAFNLIKANINSNISVSNYTIFCSSIIGYNDKAILAGHAEADFRYGTYHYFPTDSSCNFILTTDSTLYTAAPEHESPTTQTPGISALLYPNPSNGAFTLSYTLPQAGSVHIRIMDIQGRLAFQRDMGEQEEGPHEFKASEEKQLLPGIYFVQLTSGNEMSVSRLVVMGE